MSWRLRTARLSMLASAWVGPTGLGSPSPKSLQYAHTDQDASGCRDTPVGAQVSFGLAKGVEQGSRIPWTHPEPPFRSPRLSAPDETRYPANGSCQCPQKPTISSLWL